MLEHDQKLNGEHKETQEAKQKELDSKDFMGEKFQRVKRAALRQENDQKKFYDAVHDPKQIPDYIAGNQLLYDRFDERTE